MRDYGKVHTTFWESANIRALSDDGRMLAMYLLTCPHGTIAGVFRLPDGYACEDLGWGSERLQTTLSKLLSNGFATRCEATKWLWVTKHFEWNQLENPNQRKSALKVALQIPDECSWKLDFMRVCGHFFGAEQTPKAEPLRNRSETLSQSVSVTGTVIKDKAPAAPVFVLPDWIPKTSWDGYVEMRKRMRKAMTDRAMKLRVDELKKFADAGHDVAEILDKSTANGWTDVYEPKAGRNSTAAPSQLAGAI